MKNKKMDNGAYEISQDEGTELALVRTKAEMAVRPKNVAQPQAGPSTNGSPKLVCKVEVCRQARRTYRPPDLTDSPWTRTKAVSFVVIIVLFVIWIILFAVLKHIKVI